MNRRMERNSKKPIYLFIILILIGVIIFLLVNRNSDKNKNTSNTPASAETTSPESTQTSNPIVQPTTAPVQTPTLAPTTPSAPTTSSPTTPSTSSPSATTNGTTTVEKQGAYVTWAKWKIESAGNGKYYLLLYGTDEVKDTVWTYKTEESSVINFEFLGEYNQKLYLNELGKIVTINKQNGSVVWVNSDYNGKSSHYKYDSTGCIYVTSSTTPALIVIDSTGKTVRKVDKIDNYDSSKVSELAISGSTFTISYSDGKKLDLSISDIKDSSKNLF